MAAARRSARCSTGSTSGSEFKGGLRVTDRETVEVVEMVLAGSVNKEIVTAINSQGGKAVGISGKDANLMRAKRLERRWRDPSSNIEQIVDLGFVGDPAACRSRTSST